MTKFYYITSEKNSVFLNQRLQALPKNNQPLELVKKIKIKKNDNVVFFTLDNSNIKKLKKISNLKQVKKIYFYDIFHLGQVLGNTKFTNNLKFKILNFFNEMKIKLKIWFFNYDKVNFFDYSIKIKYLFVSSSNKALPNTILSIPRDCLIYTKPYVSPRLNRLIKNFKKKKINKINNSIFFFDSHFPLHPDSFPKKIIKKNRKIILNLINIYLNYLKRNLIDKNLPKKIIIFLHPRTFDILQKNKFIKNYVVKLLPSSTIISKGVHSLIKKHRFSINNDKFIVQYGSQLSLLKSEILSKNLTKIDFLELDDKFKKDFRLFKKNYKDFNNYLKNYELVEIRPFNNINKKNFIKFS